MGISGLFPWLTRRCPRIIVDAIEEGRSNDGKNISVDTTKINPNFQEFDNLYIDLNGIIHTCLHPEDSPAPTTEEEIFAAIFEYIDRLFAIVRPRKGVYVAIDGVAPRAKMNQQRSRRFRAAKEAEEKQEEILRIRRELRSKGVPLPPMKPKEEHFDSNCITPGTPFMARLATALRKFIHLRVTNQLAWQYLTVILSDASVPGEGEHKIIEFIRRQRSLPNYDPNTSHCVCAPDADLIMLGLATHERNFNILREKYVPNRPLPCEICFQSGHEFKDCQGLLSTGDENLVDISSKQTNFIFVRLPILREYLKWELAMPELPFKYDFERAVDDWVFMCFFVGNDFLPHLPSLEIYEDAIIRLIKLYKDVVYQTKGWVTENGSVNTKRVEMIMKELGKAEDEIFRNRHERNENLKNKNPQQETRKPKPALSQPSPFTFSKISQKSRSSYSNESGKKRSLLEADEDEPKLKLFKTENVSQDSSLLCRESLCPNSLNSTFDTEEIDGDSSPEDNIRLWEDGWKDRYYQQKFGISETDITFRRKVAHAYTEGLCWILKYYYQGCVSWDWYFPYHYAPFASDFDDISEFKPDWSKPTKPFYPLEQLMGVFPAASKLHVPTGWRNLMNSPDSPIFKFYPTEFKVDLNGKKFASQSVVLLPFVDEKLLIETLESFRDALTEEEKARNVFGFDFLFIGKRNPLFKSLFDFYTYGKRNSNVLDEDGNTLTKWVHITSEVGVRGEVSYDSMVCEIGVTYPTLFPHSEKFKHVPGNDCIMLAYKNPTN